MTAATLAILVGIAGGAQGGVADFACPNLEEAVREALDKPTGDITERDMGTLRVLDAGSRRIEQLDGIEYATNLTHLLLTTNEISDLGPLAGLTNLTLLTLDDNQISDMSVVAGLTNLTFLTLHGNQIGDMSAVAGLTNLKHLNLSNNEISNMSAVAGLTNLTHLMLTHNEISDLGPLAGLTNLTYLTLNTNQISDLGPLAGLTNLRILWLSDNKISDMSAVAGLTNLERLELWGNEISNMSAVAGLTNLTHLMLTTNEISDLGPLAGLTNLEQLSMANNTVSDISPIVANSEAGGLGAGDGVRLGWNYLDLTPGSDAMNHIQTLLSRGLRVSYEPQKQRPPPQAAFTFSPNEPVVEQTVQFRDTSTALDGQVVNRRWDFGDGQTSTWRTPNHQYTSPGRYTVELTVTDNHGGSDTTTQQITVVGRPPQAAFTFSLDEPGVGQTVRFTDTSTAPDGHVVSRHWEFGDGRSSTAQNPPLRYTSPGTYTVELTVTDNHGGSDTTTRQITVVARRPRAAFTFSPNEPEVGAFVRFTDTSTAPDGHVVSRHWEFGDGRSSTIQNPNHRYNNPGTYTVELTVTDEHGGTHTTTRQITVVGRPPRAAFTYEPHTQEQQLLVNKEVTFDASESRAPDGDIVRYEWAFGDGHTAEGRRVTHTYTEPGAYTVKLTVWDAHGATDTTERELQVVKGGGGGPA